MKLALLSNNENIELYEELKKEFISETYEQYVLMVMGDICKEFEIDFLTMQNSDFHKELRGIMITIINKVWLDNIMKYITQSNISEFISLVNRGMLGQDAFVNIFYARQITEAFAKYFSMNPDELYSVTDILTNRLHWIINCMYCANPIKYNEILMRMLNNIYCIVANIQFKYYKFELDQYYRPLLFYTEKEPNEAFCTQ